MSTTAFSPAWTREDRAATAFLARDFSRAEARIAAAKRAAQRTVHPAVLSALKRGAGPSPHPAQRTNLDLLARPGSCCVVTGQQAGLFGGPGYSLYKAASAVVNAAAIAAESGQPCVPIFWLQNEDHDFDEIAHVPLVDGDGDLQWLHVAEPPEQALRSIHARPLQADVAQVIEELRLLLADAPHGAEVFERLRHLYQPGVSLDRAFAELMNALFAASGLLILDPRSPGLAEAAAPVHARALADADRIADALLDRSRALQAEGFLPQVHVRPRAPLSFYHPEGPEGPRYRIEPADPEFWQLVGRPERISRTELRAAPADRFSTSALLRPILQDTWLPTVMYVGGPGEAAYFAQLAPLYELFDLPPTIFAPRARLCFVDAQSEKWLRRYGLTLNDLSLPESELLCRLGDAVGAEPSPDTLEQALREAIEGVLDTFEPTAAEINRGLARSVTRARTSLLGVSGRLVRRYRRELARTHVVATGRLGRLRARLSPEGGPQERSLGYAQLAASFGEAALMRHIFQAVRPFESALQEVHL